MVKIKQQYIDAIMGEVSELSADKLVELLSDLGWSGSKIRSSSIKGLTKQLLDYLSEFIGATAKNNIHWISVGLTVEEYTA